MLALATNLDNLCIGLSYGMAKKKIPVISNLIIALVSGIFSCVACAVARWLGEFYSGLAMILGSVLLFALGIYTLYEALFKPVCEEVQQPKQLTIQETLTLGVALAINCLGASFGVGLSSVSAWGLGLSVALFSFVFVGLGGHLGGRAAQLCKGGWLNVFSGLMLIAIAVWELFI